MQTPAIDESTPTLTYVLIGVAAGALSGLLGVGGGIVLVPLLLGVVKFDQHRAHATSLAAILLISIAGAARFAIAGEVSWILGLVLGIGGVVGSTAGARMMGKMSPQLLRVVFVVVLTVVAIRMFTGGELATGTGIEGVGSYLIALGIGVVAGFAGSVAGIGGGSIIVPALVFLLAVEQHTAGGTSLMAIVFTAVAATRVNWSAGRVDVKEGLALGLGGAVSATIAASIALGLEAPILTRIFGAFALAVAIRMAWSLFKHSNATID